jgi:hypothetical protein
MPDALDPQVLTRCVVFLVALASLAVAHQLGDHVVQTDRQAGGKAGPGAAGLRAMLGHLLGYHVTAAVLLLGTVALLGLPVSPSGVAAGLTFSAVTHGVLDRRWPVRAVLGALGSARFAETTAPICGMYLADQALHQAALFIAALLVASL